MKVKTGIPGLDNLIGGGLPKGSFTTILGEYGVGKSTLAMQYLVNGVKEYGEPGVFVTFERDTDVITTEMRRFGWHLKTFQNEGNLKMIGGPLDKIIGLGEESEAEPEDLLGEMVEVVDEMDAERLSIDGLGQFSLLFPDELSYRAGLASLGRSLSELGCTSIATIEKSSKEDQSGKAARDYVSDGLITMNWATVNSERKRALEIKKIRGSKHSTRLNYFDITESGIEIKEEI